MTFALAIPHTPWVEERVKTMNRLCDQLGIMRDICRTPAAVSDYREYTDKEPNYVWSRKMWRWLYAAGPSDCLQLQDDVIVAPRFFDILNAMCEAHPSKIIALHCPHPAGRTLFRRDIHGYTSTDGLIGVAYRIPRHELGNFLDWEENVLKPEMRPHVTEDTLIDIWAMHTGRRIWHPVPSIIDHDVEVRSTYGNDHHDYRRPAITWTDAVGLNGDEEIERMTEPSYWAPRTENEQPHLGRFYMGNHWRIPHLVKPEPGLARRVYEIEADVCPREFSTQFHYPLGPAPH